MSTQVTVRLVGPRPGAEASVRRVLGVFAAVQSGCSRFDPSSDLARVNAAPDDRHIVGELCLQAIAEAARAYEATDGLFDPRILTTLRALGYDRSLPFEDGDVCLDGGEGPAYAVGDRDRGGGPAPGVPPGNSLMCDHPVWEPRLDRARSTVQVGADPIDLGGIGKGIAVRLAAACLEGTADGFLVEAGGDLVVRGASPRPGGWRVAVEDPISPEESLAVLSLNDVGCVTSSVSVRHWTVHGRRWHHLIDPRTGRSARGGLLAVTVLHEDPAWAEVWSKAMFIAGTDQVRRLAAEQRLMALWVRRDGKVELTAAMRERVVWATPGRFA